MSSLIEVRDLVQHGRFAQAFAKLESHRPLTADKTSIDVLRVELLERLGQVERSHALARALLQERLTQADRSSLEQTLGMLSYYWKGDSAAAIAHLQKAISLADKCGDLQRLCWGQLRLLAVTTDLSQFSAAGLLLDALRRNAARLADPVVFAGLHVFVGQADAKRGFGRSAERHVNLALRLLDIDDNAWLRSVALNIRTASSFMAADYKSGIEFAEEALEHAEASGAPSAIQAPLLNLGCHHYLNGALSVAASYIERAMQVLPLTVERTAAWGTLASIAIADGKLSRARHYIGLIHDSIRTPRDWMLYANRHSLIVLADLLLRENRPHESIETAERAVALANETEDAFLRSQGLLATACARSRLSSSDDFLESIRELFCTLSTSSPDAMAHYERLLAFSFLSSGRPELAEEHRRRALRMYRQLGNVSGEAELSRVWAQAQVRVSPCDCLRTNGPETHRVSAAVLQDAVALLSHVGRAELVATDLVALAQRLQCFHGAEAWASCNELSHDVLSTFGAVDSSAGTSRLQHFDIGVANGKSVVVRVFGRDDLETVATLNTLALLVDTARALERAQAEREAQLALWPIEDLPADDDKAIITGQMREVMALARKVAMTNISALVTGESGTGKEIVARAIHTFSPRARKPFIPFNCTAVPREMLESQLFGHRRGAFTSADRDSLGMIRAAREGTLFLDEIGELGLDLQPKLLRFLESGEICPLGEPTPLHVDVRIVAATNQNLDELVRQGRFREDLFYRLNVVRITIPPLRERRDELPALVHHFVTRAAADYGKGQIRMAEETMEHLLLYAWPGNVRQLQNEIRRMIALADPDSVLSPATLSAEIRQAVASRPVPRNGGGQMAVPLDDRLAPTLARIEREMIRTALNAHGGRLEDAAKALGISRKGLYLKRQRLGL